MGDESLSNKADPGNGEFHIRERSPKVEASPIRGYVGCCKVALLDLQLGSGKCVP